MKEKLIVKKMACKLIKAAAALFILMAIPFFIRAQTSRPDASTQALGKGKTVVLDYYFNHETKKDVTGKTIQFHYVWGDTKSSGYSLFGNVFNKYGVQTKSLNAAPTSQNLKDADIYIIVDPDTEKETASPNFIQKEDINTIYDWVKKGGVLLLFSNDSANAEFTHFNQLASKFGMQFNFDSKNRVIGKKFEMGEIKIAPGNAIFKTAKQVYIKEYSSLSVQPPASAVLKDGSTNVVAVAKIGKGTVFAVGDPWFYNEYTNGKNIPMYFENDKATEDLVKWAIHQIK